MENRRFGDRSGGLIASGLFHAALFGLFFMQVWDFAEVGAPKQAAPMEIFFVPLNEVKTTSEPASKPKTFPISDEKAPPEPIQEDKPVKVEDVVTVVEPPAAQISFVGADQLVNLNMVDASTFIEVGNALKARSEETQNKLSLVVSIYESGAAIDCAIYGAGDEKAAEEACQIVKTMVYERAQALSDKGQINVRLDVNWTPRLFVIDDGARSISLESNSIVIRALQPNAKIEAPVLTPIEQ